MKMLMLAVVVFPTLALAQPQISFVDGVVMDQETVTISGIEFGTKSPVAPIKWDTFDIGSDGQILESLQPEWVPYIGNGGVYSNNTAHSGNLSVMNRTGSGDFSTNYIEIPMSDEVFISYWWSTFDTDSEDYGIIKLCRINSSVDAGGGGRYNGVGTTYLSSMSPTGSNPYFAYNNGEGSTNSLGYIDVPLEEWSRIDMYKKLSNPGQPDGRAFCQNLSSGDGVFLDEIITQAEGFNFQLDTVLLGLMFANSQGDYSLHLDDIYIDNTLARIEIGNNESFYSCTHREMQLPTAWSSDGNSIEIVVNSGSFVPGEDAWLFVIDSNGNASNGFPVVMSQSVNMPGLPGRPVVN